MNQDAGRLVTNAALMPALSSAYDLAQKRLKNAKTVI
jgi:hypothetical protein